MRSTAFCSALAGLLLVASCSESDDGASEEDPPTTSAEVSSSTTAEPSPGDRLCESLATQDYETRKRALADAGPDAAAAPCRAEVEALQGAMGVEERAASFEHEAIAVELRCTTTYMEIAMTSSAPEPAGLAGALSRYPAGQADDPRRVGTDLVAWRIEPGERVETERAIRSDELDACGSNAQVFLADDSPFDASLPGEAADDAQASDDPDEWFAALNAAEREWVEARDPNGVALTEDIRSLGYRDLLAEAAEGPGPMFDRPSKRSVCRVIDGPDEQHVGLLYRLDGSAFSYTDEQGVVVDRPEESRTQLGVFRRGADGRWRWLIRSVFIEPQGC